MGPLSKERPNNDTNTCRLVQVARLDGVSQYPTRRPDRQTETTNPILISNPIPNPNPNPNPNPQKKGGSYPIPVFHTPVDQYLH